MTTSRSIAVSNLPDFQEDKLTDKLQIHFGKRGNGGGDIDQVGITQQCGQIGTFAVITFADKETVSSVLKKQHIFHGKKLTVEPHLSLEDENRQITRTFEERDPLAEFPQLDETLPSKDFQLILNGQYEEDFLQGTAALTNTTLQVDERTTKTILRGSFDALTQAITILGEWENGIAINPCGSADGGQNDGKAKGTEGNEDQYLTNDPKSDEKSLKKSGVGKEHSESNHPEVNQNGVGSDSASVRKKVPKLNTKTSKPSPKTNKRPRNVAKFDQKILDYMHVVHYRELNELQEKFKVNFEAKSDGVVTVSGRGQNTDSQNIQDSLKSLENLVNKIQKKGLVMEIVNMMQFQEATKQLVDAARKETLNSTDVLVAEKERNCLEFYGTEKCVRQKIAKLQLNILGRKSPDVIDAQDDIVQTVHKIPNGDSTLSPADEELENMSMAGERREFLKQNETLVFPDQDLTGEKVVNQVSTAPAVGLKEAGVPSNKPLLYTFITPDGATEPIAVESRHPKMGNSLLTPLGPPTWQEESTLSFLDSTENDKSSFAKTKSATEEESSFSLRPCVNVAIPPGYGSTGPDEELQSSMKSLGLVMDRQFFEEQYFIIDRLRSSAERQKSRMVIPASQDVTAKPPMQHQILQEATRDDSKEIALCSSSRLKVEPTVEMDWDEADGADASSVSNESVIGVVPHIVSSSGWFPPRESLLVCGSPMERGRISPMETGRISPMETGRISPMETSQVVLHPSKASQGSTPPKKTPSVTPNVTPPGHPYREPLQGGMAPMETFMFGMRTTDPSQDVLLPKLSREDEDFSLTLRTGLKVTIRQGNLTDEFTDVIVTSADGNLQHSNGVGLAVRNAAGQELVTACKRWIQQHGSVKPGKNVWTTGGNLKCSNVLHVVLGDFRSGRSNQMVLKETIMNALKTCSNDLQASNVSMPAIGAARMSVSNAMWAQAFYQAVSEISELYNQGWMQLNTLVLVDRNEALLGEVKSIFSDPILSEAFKGDVPHIGRDHFVSSRTFGITGSEYAMGMQPNFAVPRLRPKGLNGRRGGQKRVPRSHQSGPRENQLQRAVGKKGSISVRVEPTLPDEIPADHDDKCAICLGRIKNEKTLHCKHRFCRVCVDTALLLQSNRYCPTCRQPVK